MDSILLTPRFASAEVWRAMLLSAMTLGTIAAAASAVLFWHGRRRSPHAARELLACGHRSIVELASAKAAAARTAQRLRRLALAKHRVGHHDAGVADLQLGVDDLAVGAVQFPTNSAPNAFL